MVSINKETYTWALQFVLSHKFGGIDFKVETFHNVQIMREIIRIGFRIPNKDYVYVDYQIEKEEWLHKAPPNIPDETIATIMLLLG